MGIIAQYQTSLANPSVVGGSGLTLKYFPNPPVAGPWSPGVTGVNLSVDSSQLGRGNTPSASSALGQLSFDTVANKAAGGRFRMYASGVVSSAITPTIQPFIQINTGTIVSPSYTSIMAPPNSAPLTANHPVAWSIVADLYYDPAFIFHGSIIAGGSGTFGSGTLSGFFKAQYAAAAGGTPLIQTILEQVLTTTPTSLFSGDSTLFGFVVAIQFGSTDPSNTASLYEFKIVQD